MKPLWQALIDAHITDAVTATSQAQVAAEAGDYKASNAAAEDAARHRWAADYALRIFHDHLTAVQQAIVGQPPDAVRQILAGQTAGYPIEPAWTVHR